jgi:hypothetical protein
LNVNSYWSKQAAQSVELMLKRNDEETIGFAVLSIARILYILDNRAKATNEKAGYYALQTLPARWHKLVREAMRISRIRMSPSLFASCEERAVETRLFVKQMINYFNQRMEEGNPL